MLEGHFISESNVHAFPLTFDVLSTLFCCESHSFITTVLVCFFKLF